MANNNNNNNVPSWLEAIATGQRWAAGGRTTTPEPFAAGDLPDAPTLTDEELLALLAIVSIAAQIQGQREKWGIEEPLTEEQREAVLQLDREGINIDASLEAGGVIRWEGLKPEAVEDVGEWSERRLKSYYMLSIANKSPSAYTDQDQAVVAEIAEREIDITEPIRPPEPDDWAVLGISEERLGAAHTLWEQGYDTETVAEFVLTLDQAAIDRAERWRIARLPYEELTTYEQANIDLALTELEWSREQFNSLSEYQRQQVAFEVQRIELANRPWEEMTVAEQSNVNLAMRRLDMEEFQWNNLSAADREQLALEIRRLDLMERDFDTLSAWEQNQVSRWEKEFELQEWLAKTPYERMTVAEQANYDLALEGLGLETRRFEELSAVDRARLTQELTLAQMPYEDMTVAERERLALQKEEAERRAREFETQQAATRWWQERQLQARAAERASEREIQEQQMAMSAAMQFANIWAGLQSPRQWTQLAQLMGQKVKMPSWMPKALPSAQTWTRLTPTQREMSLGYQEYLGGSAEDIMAEMQRRMPSPRPGPAKVPARQY